MNFWQRLEMGCDRWLSAPAVNAAGRMGLYRILYSFFYLWLISYFKFSELSLIPPIRWNPPLLLLGFPPPPGWIFPIAESLLPAALILLLFGYRTRLVTGAVLALGFGLAGMRASLLLKEHTLMLVTFYVPLFMLFSNWGSTYSLDGILRQQRGQWTPTPQNSSSYYIWPARGLMAVLAILFVSATVDKLLQGVWVSDPRFVGDLLLEKSVESYLNNGFPVNPIAAAIANNNYLIIPAQYFILLFEAAFVLVLFYPLARRIILPLALLFHCFNTFFLGVPFAAILSIYLAFPDWQAIYQGYYPKRLRLNFLKQLPSGILVSTVLILATLVGLSWNTTPIPRTVFGLGGWLRYQTIWFAVFPIVLIWIFAALYRTFSRQKR